MYFIINFTEMFISFFSNKSHKSHISLHTLTTKYQQKEAYLLNFETIFKFVKPNQNKSYIQKRN